MESFRILVYSKLQKSPSWKLKSPPKSDKSQNRPLGVDFALVVDHCFKLQLKWTKLAVACESSTRLFLAC